MPPVQDIRNYEVIWYDDEAGHLRRRKKKLVVKSGERERTATGVIGGCTRNCRFPSSTPVSSIIQEIWGGEHGYWVKELV